MRVLAFNGSSTSNNKSEKKNTKVINKETYNEYER